MKLINFIKQSWTAMRQQSMLSIVTIVGTALAIVLIMIVVMIEQVKVAPYSPESNRDRMLHATWASIKSVDESQGWSSNGPLSYQSAKALYKDIEEAEAVTIYCPSTEREVVAFPGKPPVEVDLRQTDDVYWRVFDFKVISGKPYNEADFEAGLPVAVISRSVARAVFGSDDVAGKELLIGHAPYKVAAVVQDASTLATHAYGQVWIPFTSTEVVNNTWNGVMGGLCVTILAHDEDDFDEIRASVLRNYDRYNKEIEEPTGWKFIDLGRPYTTEKDAYAFGANVEPDIKAERRSRYIVYLILLIVPAVNLSSMTESRLRRRIAEIGVRRAFGCSRKQIVFQIIGENMFITLIAGILGLLMSVVFSYLCNSLLFSEPYSDTFNPPAVDASMLIQPSTFLWALLFCFILNVLSSGIPSLRASRTDIVKALNGNKH